MQAFPSKSRVDWETFLRGLGGSPPRAVCDCRVHQPSFWRPFTADAHAVGSRRLSDWLHSTGRVLEAQFARRGLATNRPAGTPLTTPPMDAFVNPVRDAIRPARTLKNRERTNRMLMLMPLHANRHDDERAYAEHIRRWLELNRGRPSVPRRAIVDASGEPSLR